MTLEPSLFVIFGATGDLSARKLLPALCKLAAAGVLHPNTQVVGLGRGEKTREAFQAWAREALAAAGLPPEQITALSDDRLHYLAMGNGLAEDYRRLGQTLDELGRAHAAPNVTFYMSMPPAAFPDTVTGLGEAGLNRRDDGWTRLVIEKPFGRDLSTAQDLNELVHRYFKEKQVYRIDHYLGKETVQNLLVLRLGNGLIESAWNRERIESVQITVAETLGVGTRAGYYDTAGALRDMVQNHLAQLLSLVAMEVPGSFDADAIRFEKIKALRSIEPIRPERVVRGQYAAGSIDGRRVRGYLEEDGVPKSSQTETFVALEMFVDSWRWQGVPFYLRTGKCMPKRMTQIAVRFREAPVSFFRKLGCTPGHGRHPADHAATRRRVRAVLRHQGAGRSLRAAPHPAALQLQGTLRRRPRGVSNADSGCDGRRSNPVRPRLRSGRVVAAVHAADRETAEGAGLRGGHVGTA